jgi:hypothetical protein
MIDAIANAVMRGLDPRIPLRLAPCSPEQDGRDNPAMTK